MGIIRAILLTLMWFLIIGFSCNFMLTKMSHSFFIGDKKHSNVQFEPIKIQISDKLTGYGYNLDKNSDKLMIIFGGTFYTAYNSIGEYSGFYDCPVVAVDYYGTQESSGKMELKTMQKSAEQVYDFAKKKYPSVSVTIVGHSYGCGMAAYLASVRKTKNLVLVSAYCDISDMFNRIIPIFWGPMKVFLSDNIDIKKYAKSTECNVRIIGSKADNTLSSELQKKVAGCYKNVNLHIYDDIVHDNYLKDERVISEIKSIL